MRRWVFVLSAAALLVVACGRDVQPEAAAEPTQWDPCSITPEAIAATGLDPSYRDEGWGEGVVVDDWAACTFKPLGVDVPYYFSVRSTLDHSFADVRREWLEFELSDTTIGERDAFQYRRIAGRSVAACSVVVDLPPGVVAFAVSYFEDVGSETDPCSIALDHTYDLQALLPPVAK